MGRRDVFLLSIFTLVTTIAWVFFDVYHSYVDSTITETQQKQLAPVDEKFDRQLIDSVKKRQVVDPLDQSISPTPLPSITLAPTVSVQTATQSGGR